MKDMTFKSVLQEDCKNVFLNENEFADLHTINGNKMRVLIDNSELLDRSAGNPHNDGTYARSILLYVLADEFGARPKIGSKITLDSNTLLLIKNFTDEDGIYAITAEAVRI